LRTSDRLENKRPPLAQINPRLPALLEYFFDRALAVDLKVRYDSAEELRRELRAALFSQPAPFGFGVRAGYDLAAEPPPEEHGEAADEQDPHLAETVVIDGEEVKDSVRGGVAGDDSTEAPPRAEAEETTQRFGLSTGVIRAYTSTGGKAGEVRSRSQAEQRDEAEVTDTSIIRRDVERELGEQASRSPLTGTAARESLAQMQTKLDEIRSRLHKDPEDVEARISLGRLYRRAGRFSEAIVQYRRALKADYERTEALDAIGEIYQALGMERRAYDAWGLSEWLQLRRVGRLPEEHYFKLGKRLEQERLLRGALEVWEETAVLEPSNTEVWRILAHYYLKMRAFPKAVRAHRELVRLNPNDAVAHRNLAACLQNCGRYVEALDAWRRSLEIESEGEGAKRAKRQAENLQRFINDSKG